MVQLTVNVDGQKMPVKLPPDSAVRVPIPEKPTSVAVKRGRSTSNAGLCIGVCAIVFVLVATALLVGFFIFPGRGYFEDCIGWGDDSQENIGSGSHSGGWSHEHGSGSHGNWTHGGHHGNHDDAGDNGGEDFDIGGRYGDEGDHLPNGRP